MHIFIMSVTYLQNAEKIHESSKSWFHEVCTINYNLLGAVVWKWLS